MYHLMHPSLPYNYVPTIRFLHKGKELKEVFYLFCQGIQGYKRRKRKRDTMQRKNIQVALMS